MMWLVRWVRCLLGARSLPEVETVSNTDFPAVVEHWETFYGSVMGIALPEKWERVDECTKCHDCYCGNSKKRCENRVVEAAR